jgi:hypothetical protein
MTPEEQILKYLNDKISIKSDDITKIYDKLNSIKPIFLIGEWTSCYLETDHPDINTLKDLHWDGKNFRSVDDVDPVIVKDSNGKRVVNKNFGNAILREIIYRDVLSTSMIYNNLPILDHFRYINKNTILGAMEDIGSKYKNKDVLYFILKRKDAY